MSINLSDLSDSPYLVANDYVVDTIFPPMEIISIKLEDVPVPGKKDKQTMAIVYFKGAKKGWCANKTERRKLGILFNATKDIDKTWIGAKVSLKIVGNIRRQDGTRGNAIRVYEATPPPGSTTTKTQEQTAQKQEGTQP
jgi:hypothetical protein